MIIESLKDTVLCKVELGEKDINHLKHAIEELYYYEFIVGKFFTFRNQFFDRACAGPITPLKVLEFEIFLTGK